jgi:hypothetical protein
MRIALLTLLLTVPALAGNTRPVTASNSVIDTSGSSEVACSRAKYGAYQKLQNACVGWYGPALKEALTEYFVYVEKCSCQKEQSGAVTCGVNVRGSCTVDAETRSLFAVGVTFDRASAEREALRNLTNYCDPNNHETVVEQGLFGCNCEPSGGFANQCVCYARGNCRKRGGVLSVGKPSVASAEEAGHPARDGNDGKENTRWCAPDGTHGHTFRIDLGRSQALSKANVLWELPGVYRYRIDVSDDGVNWRLAADRQNNNVVSQRTEDRLSGSGRFAQITITGAQKGSGENTWDSFYEFTIE